MVRQEDGNGTGIVDSHCNPGVVCQRAADKVQQDADCGSVPINVESHVCSTSLETIEFSFLPQYLAMIVEELLKNSASATLRCRPPTVAQPDCDETIQVIVTADQRQVKIQISDKGGGIPAVDRDKVWSYSPVGWDRSTEVGNSWQ